jgi:hypothetical protein
MASQSWHISCRVVTGTHGALNNAFANKRRMRLAGKNEKGLQGAEGIVQIMFQGCQLRHTTEIRVGSDDV